MTSFDLGTSYTIIGDMQELAPEYLAEIARQLGFLGAFLGGFSATFLGTLLAVSSPRRSTAMAIAASAAAAVSFIIAVIASTLLVVVLHPAAPANVVQGASLGLARVIMVLTFLCGLLALLAAVGLSGFVRSRRAGMVTSGLAVTGALLAIWAAFGF